MRSAKCCLMNQLSDSYFESQVVGDVKLGSGDGGGGPHDNLRDGQEFEACRNVGNIFSHRLAADDVDAALVDDFF
ncbi:hypothetical protein RRG08_006142 [Elysia crispata]|uniref:Uncharacterized protein n=1 Tax=Elysia crispata TaxID=231223 RepID=A0AAE1E1Y6_9GAST|nr:hypothetical protein RRG08_006142 [Elysia crispata]